MRNLNLLNDNMQYYFINFDKGTIINIIIKEPNVVDIKEFSYNIYNFLVSLKLFLYVPFPMKKIAILEKIL